MLLCLRFRFKKERCVPKQLAKYCNNHKKIMIKEKKNLNLKMKKLNLKMKKLNLKIKIKLKNEKLANKCKCSHIFRGKNKNNQCLTNINYKINQLYCPNILTIITKKIVFKILKYSFLL